MYCNMQRQRTWTTIDPPRTDAAARDVAKSTVARCCHCATASATATAAVPLSHRYTVIAASRKTLYEDMKHLIVKDP